jgi:phospholipid-binding lipoprotein MlaA
MSVSLRQSPLILLFALLLGACAGPGARQEEAAAMAAGEETSDPFESFNRAMFAFNEKFDAWLLKPAAQGYDFVMPELIKQGIGNFFRNIIQPSIAVNDLLQGKVAQSARDTGRFLVNTTFGVLGFMDVAKPLGLEPRDEDWGQTFAVWGAGDGPYFVWPIIGPRTLRDTFGFGFDWVSNPVTYARDPYWKWGLYATDLVDTRARLLPAEKVIEQAAGEDKYIFIREAYRQRRRNLIYDGNPPKPKFFEDELDAPARPAAPAGDAR